MPIYSFEDLDTGEIIEEFMPYSKKAEFLEGKNYREIFSVNLGYNYSTKKIDDGFNDVLKRIKKGSPGSTIQTK